MSFAEDEQAVGDLPAGGASSASTVEYCRRLLIFGSLCVRFLRVPKSDNLGHFAFVAQITEGVQVSADGAECGQDLDVGACGDSATTNTTVSSRTMR
jgi:hypothetical protein